MVRDTLRALVTEWRSDAGARSTAVAALAGAADLRHEVDREAAALVVDAATTAAANRWTAPDVRRVARRRSWVDSDIERIVSAAVEGERLPPLPSGGGDRIVAMHRMIAAAVFLADLPPLPELPGGSVPDDEAGPDDVDVRVLEKVRALLAKAESTTFDAEAEAFTAKAQELMARYAIDEALVDAGSREACAVLAGGVRIGIDEPYASPKAVLLARIARENRCRSVWSDQLGLATVFGARGDLRAVEVLYTSLLVQAVTAMQRAGAQVDRSGRSRTRSFRHAFLLAFADRIGERLSEATHAAEAAAIREVGEAFLPVLASRAEAAERARDAVFPRTTKMRTTLSNGAGYRAGRAAADAASIERGAPINRR